MAQPKGKHTADTAHRSHHPPGAQATAHQELIMPTPSTAPAVASYEIRFQSLFKEGRALSFPCDRDGRFDLEHAPERLRSNYLFARAMLGREFAMPVVLERVLH
jgi:hypothetical protein